MELFEISTQNIFRMSHLFGENTCMYYSKKTKLETREVVFLRLVEILIQTTKGLAVYIILVIGLPEYWA